MIAERVDGVLRRQLGEGFDWTGRTALMAAPGLELDSLDLVKLVMGLEEEFELEIPDEEVWPLGACVPRFQLVGDLVDYLAQRLSEKPAMFA